MSKGKRFGLACLGVAPVVVVLLWQLFVTTVSMFVYMMYRIMDPAISNLDTTSDAYNQAIQQINNDFLSGNALAITTFLVYIGYLIIFGIWYYFMYCKREKSMSWKQILAPKRVISIIFAGIMIQIALDVILTVLFNYFPTLYDSYSAIMDGLSDNSFYMVISVCILAPIGEELIFRGLTMRTFLRVMPVPLAMAIQALLFGAYHMNVIQGIYAASLGVCLGFVAYKYDSIVASILLHMAINSSSYLVSYLLSFSIFENDIVFIVTGVISLIAIIFLLIIATKGVGQTSDGVKASNSLEA